MVERDACVSGWVDGATVDQCLPAEGALSLYTSVCVVTLYQKVRLLCLCVKHRWGLQEHAVQSQQQKTPLTSSDRSTKHSIHNCYALLKDPVGARMRLPGAASAAGPPDDARLVRLLLPLLLAPMPPLRSPVARREPALEPAGLSIQSSTSLCACAARPTSSTRWPAPPFLQQRKQTLQHN